MAVVTSAWLAPKPPKPMPDWSPVSRFGGYQGGTPAQARAMFAQAHRHSHAHGTSCAEQGHGKAHATHHRAPASGPRDFWGAWGCLCHAF